jgi:anti-sigma28 factor (negative regulator of flagellin synthesis)
MKITSPFGSFSTGGTSLERDSTKRSGRTQASSPAAAESARSRQGGSVSLSAEALIPSSVRDWFDSAKVDRLRTAYEAGRLQGNSREVAARMLEDA